MVTDAAPSQTAKEKPGKQPYQAANEEVNILQISRNAALQDILYVISDGAAIPIPVLPQEKELIKGQKKIANAYEKAITEATELAQVASALVDAKAALKTTQDSEAVVKAQGEVRKALAKYSTGSSSESEPPLKGGQADFVEVYSFAKQQILLLPTKSFTECRTRQASDDNVYFVEALSKTSENALEKSETKTTAANKRSASLRDILAPFRPLSAEGGEQKGELDQSKIHQSWGELKKKIAMGWELGKIKKEGQIPSRHLALAVSPALANFFKKEDYQAIDAFVAKVNKSAQARWNTYDAQRKELVERLEGKQDVSPDEWNKLIREIKDIWWDGWETLPKGSAPKNEFEKFAFESGRKSRPSNEKERMALARELAKAKLPPVMWDASVGAQLMRYTAGATLKADFDVLKTGRLGIEASAEAGFSLLEGKADANCFVPSSAGKRLEFELPIRKKEAHWTELRDCNGDSVRLISSGPHFAFDRSIVSPRGIFELGEAVSGWAFAAAAAQKQFLTAADEPLRIQVAGHTDAIGENLYNQSLSERRALAGYGLLAGRPEIWVNMFTNNTKAWGDYEVKLMAAAVLCARKWELSLDWSKIETVENIEEQLTRASLPKKGSSELGNLYVFDDKARENQAQALKALSTASTAELVAMFQEYVGQQYFILHPQYSMFKPSVDGSWDVKTGNGRGTLSLLVQMYIYGVKQEVNRVLPDVTFYNNLSFHTDQTQGLGESQLKVQSAFRERENRRIELIPYVISKETSTKESAPYNFGDVRIKLSGSIKGEAGANINLAGTINLDINKQFLVASGVIAAAFGGDVSLTGSAKREMDPARTSSYEKTTTGQQPNSKVGQGSANLNAEAGAKAAAFAGAKAELGIKAAIDWRAPEKNEQTQKAPEEPSKSIVEFVTLGDIGFNATGMAGVGLEGEFKIGFDRESRRFQIKISAKGAVGLGFGGGFSFSVAIDHMFDFVKVVHDQLADNNFHFVDVFESEGDESGVNVYELFSAWSYEMFKRGHILEAGMTWAAGNALEGALEILQSYDDVLDKWSKESNEAENLDTLIATIRENPPQLKYSTPETKGRLLYRLLQAKVVRQGTGWFDQRLIQAKRWGYEPGQRWNEILETDRYYDIEEAALTIIEKGVSSSRDWQKTLENMAEIQEDGTMCVAVGSQGGVNKKTSSAQENEMQLRSMLLGDEEDLRRLEKHLKGLAS